MTPFDQQGRINDTVITNTILNTTSIHSSVRLVETALKHLGSINRTATLIVHGN